MYSILMKIVECLENEALSKKIHESCIERGQINGKINFRKNLLLKIVCVCVSLLFF